MPIERSDVKYWKPRLVTDLANNGGRRGTSELACGVFEALIPSWSVDERTAGAVRLRKLHVRNHSALAGRVAQLYMHGYTTDDDVRTLIGGTFRGTQGDLVGDRGRNMGPGRWRQGSPPERRRSRFRCLPPGP
jgi:hypothetical protein